MTAHHTKRRKNDFRGFLLDLVFAAERFLYFANPLLRNYKTAPILTCDINQNNHRLDMLGTNPCFRR